MGSRVESGRIIKKPMIHISVIVWAACCRACSHSLLNQARRRPCLEEGQWLGGGLNFGGKTIWRSPNRAQLWRYRREFALKRLRAGLRGGPSTVYPLPG